MDLKPDFSFRPLPEIANPVHLPFPKIPNPLGPLALLPGTWIGKGFNTIWRPNHDPASDRFLELNLTDETLEFTAISGAIPNRGLLQPDINMFGITYLQQIKDSNLNAGLHIEPGIWAAVPPTTDPNEPSTVVRMASIPHGTTMLAQGVSQEIAGPPSFAAINIDPFPIGHPANHSVFPEQNLAAPTPFRSPPPGINGITQAMVNNPNSVLQAAIAGQTILHTTVLEVTTTSSPVAGGGTSNTAFLAGTQHGPNADAAQVVSTFWIETVKGAPGQPNFHQLQYSQNVLLNFRGLSWPHVTVATLRQKTPVNVPIQWLDPRIPIDLLHRIEQAPKL
ncbi:MAG: heme-binding protein [Allosphingosinicella sp.]